MGVSGRHHISFDNGISTWLVLRDERWVCISRAPASGAPASGASGAPASASSGAAPEELDSSDDDIPLPQRAQFAKQQKVLRNWQRVLKKCTALVKTRGKAAKKAGGKVAERALIEEERVAAREQGSFVMELPAEDAQLSFHGSSKDRGRIVFIPSSYYGNRVVIEKDHAVGWRGVVEGVTQKGLVVTVLGEEGTANAKVNFGTVLKCVGKGVYPLTR